MRLDETVRHGGVGSARLDDQRFLPSIRFWPSIRLIDQRFRPSSHLFNPYEIPRTLG